MRSHKWIPTIAFSVFLAFAFVDLSENYIHHHTDQTEDSDCAFCSFHKAFSHSDLSAAPVEMVPLFHLFIAALVLLPTYRSFKFLSQPGRGPPVVLS